MESISRCLLNVDFAMGLMYLYNCSVKKCQVLCLYKWKGFKKYSLMFGKLIAFNNVCNYTHIYIYIHIYIPTQNLFILIGLCCYYMI